MYRVLNLTYMEAAILSAVKPFTCANCGSVDLSKLATSNPFLPCTPCMCCTDADANASEEKQIKYWIGAMIYDTMAINDVYVKLTIRRLTAIVPPSLYPQLHKIAWIARRICHISDICTYIGKVVELMKYTPIDEMYNAILKLNQHARHSHGHVNYDAFCKYLQHESTITIDI